MSVSELFIRRPVMTTLVMVAFLVFGLIAYTQLPVSDLPNVDFPSIMVSASLPGANADTMAAAVATPLERQFSNIAGLETMSSTSALGVTQITLQFNLNRKIDGAAQDVQTAIVAARPQLPPSMPTPPTYFKMNPADSPILYISLSSPLLPLYKVDEYAENLIAQRLSMVTGVAQVQVYGSQIYAVRVQVDPNKLATHGIEIDEVRQAITGANVNLPTGTLYGQFKAYDIKANGQLFNAESYRPLVVAYRNGAPVRLSDLSTVTDSVQNDKVASWYKKTRAVVLAVQRQPGTNTIAVVDSVRELMPYFRAVIPGSVNLDILFDRSLSIRKSAHDVQVTLLITMALVVVVIFLFLGNLSATIIASLALPISIIGTFGAMRLFGFSLNNLSLMALTLSVGFVVDDAIVMLENIVRHMETGKPALQAALEGSREIGFTIVSMTLSLVAVFIPVLLMGGLIGRLFTEFGVTISVEILLSGFIALSLTPMLCSRFLRTERDGNHTGINKLSQKAFKALQGFYGTTLAVALRHRGSVMVIFVAMVVATFYLGAVIPKGFMPGEDTGQIFGMTEAVQGISFNDMVHHQKALAEIIYNDPNVDGFMSSVGASGPNSAGNTGRIFVVLKPRPQRRLKVDQVIQELRPKVEKITGIHYYMQNPASMNIGGRLSKALYQYTLQGPDTEQLYKSSTALEEKMRHIPGLIDVNSDLQIKNLQVNVEVERDKCYQLGISMQQVEQALNSAYSSRQVSTIYTPTNEYWVIMEVEPRYYRDPSVLHMLYLKAGNGSLVPLDTLAKITKGVGPLLVNHLGQFPSVTISFNLKPGVALSQAVGPVKEAALKILPENVTGDFQGTAQAFQSSVQNLWVLLLIAILVIYIVLGILYESFIHPLTILSGLPSAGLGALIILLLFHVDLDLYGFLGLVMLIGIVKKNAIMMIDFALQLERTEHKDAESAIYEACLTRFRPVMMTTSAALMGCLPIAIGMGAGSESRQPLGLTVVGGLLVSQLVTLYITPVFYIYLDKFQRWIKKRGKGQALVFPAELSPQDFS